MLIDVRLPLWIRVWIVASFAIGFSGSHVAADTRALQLSRGQVRVVCPLTVGGAFEAKTSSVAGTLTRLSGSPAVFAGEVVVDLRMLDTGIGLRDSHLRTRYLETDKGDGFDKAVVSDLRLADVDPDTFEGRTHFTATLLLHGTRNPVAGEVQVRRNGSSRHAEVTFPVKISEYGIAKPQYLGVGVKNEVIVRVTFDLLPASTPAVS
jgi:hypothetical protein